MLLGSSSLIQSFLLQKLPINVLSVLALVADYGLIPQVLAVWLPCRYPRVNNIGPEVAVDLVALVHDRFLGLWNVVGIFLFLSMLYFLLAIVALGLDQSGCCREAIRFRVHVVKFLLRTWYDCLPHRWDVVL